MTRTQPTFAIRPYRDEDEPAVLRLMDDVLGAPGRPGPSRLFRWKHIDNPFGRAFILVAEDRGEIIGLRTFMRWRFRAGRRELSAVRAVDTVTHRSFRRQGVFSRLTQGALDALEGEVDLVFNTPNPQSGAGYLKLGWKVVGTIRVRVRVRRPLRFLAGARSAASRDPAVTAGAPAPPDAPPAGEVLEDAEPVGALLEAYSEGGDRLATPRDLTYLRWRYGAPNDLDYRAVRVESGGALRGLGIFRVRGRGRLWEGSVAEVFVPRGDVAGAAKVLREIRRASPADHLTCHFPSGTTAARGARRSGFLPSPAGPMFVVRPLRADLDPDPTDLGSWALSLGDVEVF